MSEGVAFEMSAASQALVMPSDKQKCQTSGLFVWDRMGGPGSSHHAPRYPGEWLLFFLRSLTRQKDVLARKVERERRMAPLPPLAAELLRLAREHGRLTIAGAIAATKANRSTVKLHLRQLTQAGLLVLRGQRRGAWYEPV